MKYAKRAEIRLFRRYLKLCAAEHSLPTLNDHSIFCIGLLRWAKLPKNNRIYVLLLSPIYPVLTQETDGASNLTMISILVKTRHPPTFRSLLLLEGLLLMVTHPPKPTPLSSLVKSSRIC